MKQPSSSNLSTQQTQNIILTFIQCWTNVGDFGPTNFQVKTAVATPIIMKRSSSSNTAGWLAQTDWTEMD